MSRHHYVEYFSPGTFVAETTSKSTPAWDTLIAARMAEGITERHNAKPYGFRFETYLEADPIPDSEGGTLRVQGKRVDKSGMHFLGGRLRSYADVCKDNDPKEGILRSNMLCNGCAFVVENTNSFRSTQPFTEEDILLDGTGNVVMRGDHPDLMPYRKAFAEQRAKELAS